MKAILEFNLPDEQEELKLAQNGAKYSFLLDELDSNLRSMIKYENKVTIRIDAVRELIVKLREDYEL